MNNYWNDNHEELVKNWSSANTRTQYHIYNELYTTVHYMASSILYRYYFKFDNIKVLEAISDLYCNLHEYNPNKGKAFSFCQTIIKNYYYNIYKPNKIKILELEYTDELPDIWYDEYEENLYQHKFNELYKIINELQFKLKTFTLNNKGELNKLISEYVILTTMLVLIKKHSNDNLSLSGLMENISNECNYSQSLVGKYMNKYLSINPRANYEPNSKIDSKYECLGMLNNDYLYTDVSYNTNNKRKRLMKNMTFQTF